MALSSKRAAMVAAYDIKEEGLKNLVDDLCLESATEKNIQIILHALEGRFSDFGSPYDTPATQLQLTLQAAGYTGMLEKNKNQGYCRYDHDFGAKANTKHSHKTQSDVAHQAQQQLFANSIFSVMNQIQKEVETNQNKTTNDDEEKPQPESLKM